MMGNKMGTTSLRSQSPLLIHLPNLLDLADIEQIHHLGILPHYIAFLVLFFKDNQGFKSLFAFLHLVALFEPLVKG